MLANRDTYSNNAVPTEQATFKTTKDFMYSKEFHIMLHGYCTQACDEDKELMQLINTCFTEKGTGEDDSDTYMDVWKTSRILLDVYNGDLSDHKDIFESVELTAYFKRFLGGFYNYFFAEYKPYLIDMSHFVYRLNANDVIKEKQDLLNLITDTFRMIIGNVEKHAGAAK